MSTMDAPGGNPQVNSGFERWANADILVILVDLSCFQLKQRELLNEVMKVYWIEKGL